MLPSYTSKRLLGSHVQGCTELKVKIWFTTSVCGVANGHRVYREYAESILSSDTWVYAGGFKMDVYIAMGVRWGFKMHVYIAMSVRWGFKMDVYIAMSVRWGCRDGCVHSYGCTLGVSRRMCT